MRKELVCLQQRLGQGGGVVLEGRDIGTVVFPQAEVKFFLTASAAERGRRRWAELQARGVDVDLPQTIAEVEARDVADSNRLHAPLKRAADAINIDSDGQSIEEVLALMQRGVQCALGGKGQLS